MSRSPNGLHSRDLRIHAMNVVSRLEIRRSAALQSFDNCAESAFRRKVNFISESSGIASPLDREKWHWFSLKRQRSTAPLLLDFLLFLCFCSGVGQTLFHHFSESWTFQGRALRNILAGVLEHRLGV